MRPRRSHMRCELNIANECYFGWRSHEVMARWSMDLGDPIFSGSKSAKSYAPSALAYEMWIEYRERVLFWMTVTWGNGAMVMGLGWPYFVTVRIAKMSKNTKKNFGIETLFSQPIFMVLGRELLPKFSIVTKIFSKLFRWVTCVCAFGARI